MAKVKPNEFRGQIFDKLAECFGDSVLGMYENKLRIEMVKEDGEVVQFSLAPVVHKTLVDPEECDKLIPIKEQMVAYEAEKGAKSPSKAKPKAEPKAKLEVGAKSVTADGEVTLFDRENKVVISDEEQAKLDDLSARLANGMF